VSELLKSAGCYHLPIGTLAEVTDRSTGAATIQVIT
jgi:selenide,water dikinase